METDVEDILKKWGIPADVIEDLKGKEFDMYCLKNAPDAMIQNLVPPNKFGSPIRILTKRKDWIKAKAENSDVSVLNESSECAFKVPSVNQTEKDKQGDMPNISQEGLGRESVSNVPSIQVESVTKTHNKHEKTKKGLGREDFSKVSSIQVESDDDNKEEPPQKKLRGPTNFDGATYGDRYDLKALLSKSLRGRSVLSKYESCQSLPKKYKDYLCQIIVDEEQQSDTQKKISFERSDFLADKITEVFTCESKKVWIFKIVYPNGKTQLSGKLYNRYYNSRRRSETIGLNDLRNAEKSVDDVEEQNTSMDNDPDIMFLKNNSPMWDKVEAAWRSTACVRLGNLVKVAEKTCAAYMSQLSVMLESCGLKLLEMEFDYLYPNKSMEFYTHWPKCLSFLLRKNREKNPEFLKDAVYTTREENLQVLLNVSQVFSSITIAKKKKQQKKQKQDEWKSTRVTSQEGFLTHFSDIRVMNERLKERSLKLKRYSLSLQPVAAVVGPLQSPSQFLLVLDNYHYDFKSPLLAVDAAFKVYHALHAKYPPEAEHIWTFVQKAIYGIVTKTDRKFGEVEGYVHEFLPL